MKLIQKIAFAYIRTMLNTVALISKDVAARKAFKIFVTPVRKKIGETPDIFVKAEKLGFAIESKKVAGYRWNHPQQKKVLILHGFTSSSSHFDRYVSVMLKKNYEVLAFDAPAHGQSEGKQVNVLQYRKMIEEIIARYGPIDSFIAHSFGGLAVSLALEAIPHSSKTRVALIAPVTETSSAVDSFFSLLQLNVDIRSEFDELIRTSGGQPVQWYSIARALKNIHANILWVHDKEDDVTPFKDVEPVMQINYPNVRFMITNGWGHRRIYREESVVETVSEFLSVS